MRAQTEWFAPFPSELPAARTRLDFGLRGDDLLYRDLVVPQAGRVWFVRELSWALGALQLVPRLRAELDRPPSPMDVAHGIEAVGSKLAWWREFRHRDDPPPRRRVIGQRAFARDHDLNVWSFHALARRENYVQNTHRLAIVRALRREVGLGLVDGRQFRDMVPVSFGEELAATFLSQRVGRGRGRLEDRLVEWIGSSGSREDEAFLDGMSALAALGPLTPSDHERALVARAIRDGEDDRAERRRAVAVILRQSVELPDIENELVPALRASGRDHQANEVLAARAFGTMLDALVDLAVAARTPIASTGRVATTDRLVVDSGVDTAMKRLDRASSTYLDAATTAETIDHAPEARQVAVMASRETPARALGWLLSRAPDVFDVREDRVGPGDLFRRLERLDSRVDDALEAEANEGISPIVTDRTFHLEGFHQLLHDCHYEPGGAA